MSESNAAGRKTESAAQQPNGFARYIESLLGMATEGMRGSLDRSNKFAPENDDYGHRRSSEVDCAIRYGTLGAQLLTALAKTEAKREK